MTDYQPLRDALDEATREYNTYPSTYREIRSEFVGKGKDWQDRFAQTLGVSKRQIQRYEKFVTGESGQARNPDNARGATKAAIIKYGQGLEPVKRDAPPGGLTVTISGSQGSGKYQRDRDFTVSMDHQLAAQFVQNPTLEDFFKQVYPKWPDAVDVLFGSKGDDSGHLDDVEIDVA